MSTAFDFGYFGINRTDFVRFHIAIKFFLIFKFSTDINRNRAHPTDYSSEFLSMHQELSGDVSKAMCALDWLVFDSFAHDRSVHLLGFRVQ